MILWITFIVCVVGALALDLGVFNRSPHVITTKEASIWTSIWVGMAFLFSFVVYFAFKNGWIDNPTGLSPDHAVIKYITGYLIELSLSVDNIFVIAIIFSSFAIPPKYRHEILFYGVLGAIIFRAVMIIFGVALINKFSWIIYVFGVFLIYTAIKMLNHKSEDFDPTQSKMLIWIKKIFPVTYEMEGDKFFIERGGARLATPLFVTLVIVELTDVMFAIDSIPAILAVTTDTFLVFSSNILAIMGLRSMFFLISGMLDKFRYINYSLVAILAFVGIKMLLSSYVHFPEWASLGFIVVSLALGILFSIYKPGETAIEEQNHS